MLANTPAWIIWTVAAVQLGGLTMAWLTRLTFEGPLEALCQWAFFGALVSVAAAAVTTLELGPPFVLSAGTTMTLMALAATSRRSEMSVI